MHSFTTTDNKKEYESVELVLQEDPQPELESEIKFTDFNLFSTSKPDFVLKSQVITDGQWSP